RAFLHDRTRLAVWLATARETLTPGLGARQERDLIETARAVRAGETDGLLAALRARRNVAVERRERQAIDDRMLLILLSARRWREAIELFEARAEEGIRPHEVPLYIEMTQAYAEVGNLDGAARVVSFLEQLPRAGEPDLAPHLARSRLL